MLLDSNIVIYLAKPSHSALRTFLGTLAAVEVSATSYVEALGFPGLDPAEERIIRDIFRTAKMLPIDQPILDRAVHLRQQRRMGLGDALVAATALVHDSTLVTP